MIRIRLLSTFLVLLTHFVVSNSFAKISSKIHPIQQPITKLDAYQSAVKLFEKVQGERDRQFSFFLQTTISEDVSKHDLPVALKVKFRGRTVYTAVDNIDYDVASNTYKCTLYAMISIPELGKEYLYFKASDVPFNYVGMVSSENVVMNLLSSAANSAVVNTDMGRFKLKPSECKLYIGCSGITKVSLSGDLALKTDYFVSASDDTSPVIAHVGAFDITDTDIVSMQGKVSVEPFKIVAVKATSSSTTAGAKAAIVLQEFEFSIDSTANNALFCFNSPIKDSKTGKTLAFPTNYLGRISATDGNYTFGEVMVQHFFDPNAGAAAHEQYSSTDYQGMGNWTGIVAENVNIKWNCKYAGPNKKELPAAKLVIDELGLTTQIDVDATKIAPSSVTYYPSDNSTRTTRLSSEGQGALSWHGKQFRR